MHEPRPLAAEAIGHAGQHAVDVARGARAALHREPKRLVQHQHLVVLVEDHGFDRVAVGLRRAAGALTAPGGAFFGWRTAKGTRTSSPAVTR